VIGVFDTNVLIAALITEGVCSKLLRRARSGEFSLVSCPFIIAEIRGTLSKKFRLAREETDWTMMPIHEALDRMVDHDLNITGICRDADDDNVLACAFAAKADYLVTGDSDLLEIGAIRGVKIVTPRDFESLFP
jgi:putative PIN family toxin of toxin-antitoxin system